MTSCVFVFDILHYAKQLQQVGFTEKQVEAQVNIIREQANAVNGLVDSTLATKHDLQELKIATASELKSLEEYTKGEFKATKIEIKRLEEHIVAMGYKPVFSLGSIITIGIAILGFLVKA